MEKNQMEEKALLSANDICKYLSIGTSTAYKLLHTKGFPMVQIGRRKYANKVLLDKWLIKQTEGEVDECINIR